MSITIPWAVCACMLVKLPSHAISAVCAFAPHMCQGPRPLTAPQQKVACLDLVHRCVRSSRLGVTCMQLIFWRKAAWGCFHLSHESVVRGFSGLYLKTLSQSINVSVSQRGFLSPSGVLSSSSSSRPIILAGNVINSSTRTIFALLQQPLNSFLKEIVNF